MKPVNVEFWPYINKYCVFLGMIDTAIHDIHFWKCLTCNIVNLRAKRNFNLDHAYTFILEVKDSTADTEQCNQSNPKSFLKNCKFKQYNWIKIVF